jgi:N-acetylglutamate synthase-like GNAT family acetyltransferase
MALKRNMIRLATEEDLEEILAVINITNRPFYKGIVPSERFKDPFMSCEELKEEFERKDFYVYGLEGRIVGVAALEASKTHFTEVGIVTRMYVLPEFQRRGIGTSLTSEIERRAKGQRIREILIWTAPKARWAIPFYKKVGYREIDPTARYGDEAIDDRIKKHGRELLVLRKVL